jgi:hypothetical protein
MKVSGNLGRFVTERTLCSTSSQRMTVVVAFDPEPEEAESDEVELCIVTAWRTSP